MNASVAIPHCEIPNNASQMPVRLASRTVSRALLVILRVYLGVILLITNLGKLTRENPFATELLNFVRRVVTRRTSAHWLKLVLGVVLPQTLFVIYYLLHCHSESRITSC